MSRAASTSTWQATEAPAALLQIQRRPSYGQRLATIAEESESGSHSSQSCNLKQPAISSTSGKVPMDPYSNTLYMLDEDYFDHEDLMIEAMALHRQQHATLGASSSHRPNSQPRMFIRRNPLKGHERLWKDYFAQPPIYPPNVFRRRFRMNRDLFLRIHSTVQTHDDYFIQKRDASGRLGLSSLQKMTTAIRMLAYGITADLMDEYVRIGESTARLSMKKFVKAIVSIFGGEYLRSLTSNDIARLLEVGQMRGFPGMLGSIDCMHWKWKNCPSAWKCMYSDHVNEPTIILEAVASYDLWIWHAFFGLPGSHNDINVLDRSSVFAALAESRAPPCNYTINGHEYTMGYYLADGIYLSWATLVKTIPAPHGKKKKHFTACQESARKDVERAFGILQFRFAIVHEPARYFHPEVLNDIMYACIILHNMIVEDERHLYLGAD
ncbi:uncharacterized protein LOC122294710 [Carya illinoinensis]|uniref:uncharacterized protein LOC122294710 n=1 Tax=Carya illinoinensis TaxID=32201 RepID=UPI001C71E609|nr:uncharacterized protein LOC122294710 [Carya illinoinensis]